MRNRPEDCSEATINRLVDTGELQRGSMKIQLSEAELYFILHSLRTAADAYEEAAHCAELATAPGDCGGVNQHLRAQAVRGRNLADRLESGELEVRP